jgi:hypothetical protein
MATVEQKIGEHDLVELREPIESWPAGTLGAVIYEQGDLKLVEISDDQGVGLDELEVREPQLKLISKHGS